MKFYYEGQLIRTSKTHHYSFACINRNKNDDGKFSVYGCSATRAGAEKVKEDQLRIFHRTIEYNTLAMKAKAEGKKGYRNTRGEFIRFQNEETPEEYIEACKRHIEQAERGYKGVSENWIIVEITEEA